jgi:hypothetical protein
MTLWQEIFNPSPVTAIPITEDDFNSAWNWIWTNQNPALVLTLIRRRSLEFRRAGNGMDESAQMAAISLWHRFRKTYVPTRKTTEIAVQTTRIAIPLR